MISIFDRLVACLFSKNEVRQRREEFIQDSSSYDSNPNRKVESAYGAIDTKATAILQHVSIMIAVSGLLFSNTGGFFKWAFGIETVLYVVLTLFCLRLFMPQYHNVNSSSVEEDVVAKEAILDIAAKFTFLISAILIILVLIKLVTG
jgi:hypothetical protein